MKSILVIGGTTFVSSSLAKYLIGQGYNVDILTRGNKKVDYDGFREHLICDRKLRNEMQEVLKGKKYEFIFDISAYTKDDVEVLLSSIDNSILKKYIFCSSGAVYMPSNVLIQEECKKGENSNWGNYGVNKKEAEDFIITSGLPYIIFRPTYIYGENNNLYREAYFFDRIRTNKAITLPFGNNITNQFIHIDDLIRVFESSMNNKNVSKIYNVTNPEIVSWVSFITKCGEAVGKSPIIKKIDINQSKLAARSYFPFRDVTYMLDIKKLIEDGLYIPTVPLKNGLKQTYQWYIDKRPNLNDVKMMSKVDELVTDYIFYRLL